MDELKTNPKYRKNLYIIEGVNITWMDPMVMVKKPLIIMGCSRFKALFNRAKRWTKYSHSSILGAIFKHLREYSNSPARNFDDDKEFFHDEITNLL